MKVNWKLEARSKNLGTAKSWELGVRSKDQKRGGFVSTSSLQVLAASCVAFLLFLTTAHSQDFSCITKTEEKIVRGDSLKGLVEPGDTIKILFGYFGCNPVLRGEIVAYQYAGNPNPIIKIVKAGPGDQFGLKKESEAWQILVNGAVLTNSKGETYQFNDRAYQMLFQYERDYKGVIPSDSYLILGNQASGSLDSSRFGLVAKSDILGKVVPVGPWETAIPKEKITYIQPHQIAEKHRRWEFVLILDVRDSNLFVLMHLPTAMPFPYEQMITDWQKLPKDKEIILYCGTADCPLSTQAAQLLLWHGFTNVKVLEGGLDSWIKAGLPTAQLNPPFPPWELQVEDSQVKRISVAELKKRLDGGENLLLLDVLAEQAYREGHIAGATSMPVQRLEQEWQTLPKDKDIILYCGGLGCPLSQRAAKFLMWKGYQNVWELDDGTHAWQAAGFPLEKSPSPSRRPPPNLTLSRYPFLGHSRPFSGHSSYYFTHFKSPYKYPNY